ncbi:MAG TPA: hypothetical protein VFR40_16385 [Lapillicoccus sp.]|nr:hypothetical protein [Lapillicoccus sp.]
MHSSSLADPGLPTPVRVAIKALALGLALAGVLVVLLSPLFVR